MRSASPSFSGMLSPKMSLIRKLKQQSRPYIATELGGSLLVKKIGPRFFLPTLVISWGVICIFQGQKLSVILRIFFCQQPCDLISPLLQDL